MTEARLVDPRAVRAVIVAATGRDGIEPVVFEPTAVPLAPGPHAVGSGSLGRASTRLPVLETVPDAEDGLVLVDSAPTRVRLRRFDEVHHELIEGAGDHARRTSISLLPLERLAGPPAGTVQREVLVDGWRVVVEIESERRASLRERARRGREETIRGGPTQVRAIIPGRIVSVSIVPGDLVVAGQQLLVVEAMKMQNELRAPRDGIVSTVAVGVGGTIEVGDLLLVLQ